jgi:hypothetical protein
MKKIKLDNIEFVFYPDEPYVIFMNIDDVLTEELEVKQVDKLMEYLRNIRPFLEEKISFKGTQITKEEIIELHCKHILKK